jgi:hypothetical protein
MIVKEIQTNYKRFPPKMLFNDSTQKESDTVGNEVFENMLRDFINRPMILQNKPTEVIKCSKK